jgi:hypothetical protein
MTVSKLLSSRMNDPQPFTDEEMHQILTEGDAREVFNATLICKNDGQCKRLKERLVTLGAKL